MATSIGYSVPKESLEFWRKRLEQFGITHSNVSEKFGEEYFSLQDIDGLNIDLIAGKNNDERKPWQTAEVNEAVAIKGFHNVTLTLKNIKPTALILTDIFGYELKEQQGNRYRFRLMLLIRPILLTLLNLLMNEVAMALQAPITM